MRKRSRYPGRNARAGFAAFVVVVILAVAAGYAGTKYIIFPFLFETGPAGSGNQSDGSQSVTETAVDVIPSAPSIIIDQQNLKNNGSGNTETTSGTAAGPYSVQFGSYSTQAGAEEMSGELTDKGIYSYVYQSGSSYKVLGLPYSNKEKAKQAAAIVSEAVSDVFVVDLSNLIP
jgi:hypothetical protein